MVALFYIPRVWTEETELKNTKFVNGKSVRQWMQIIGSTLRASNPQVFVQTLEAKIAPYFDTDEVVCIPDLRYNNEKDLIYGYHGKIIRLSRPGFVVKSNHESEIDWLSFSPVTELNNDSTLENLYENGKLLLNNDFAVELEDAIRRKDIKV
jgi:hypothetical protein